MRLPGKLIFIDTSAVIAARDARDANHEAAIEYLREANAQRRRFLVTHFVFAEVHAYFCRDHKAAITLGELLLNDPLFTTCDSPPPKNAKPGRWPSATAIRASLSWTA